MGIPNTQSHSGGGGERDCLVRVMKTTAIPVPHPLACLERLPIRHLDANASDSFLTPVPGQPTPSEKVTQAAVASKI